MSPGAAEKAFAKHSSRPALLMPLQALYHFPAAFRNSICREISILRFRDSNGSDAQIKIPAAKAWRGNDTKSLGAEFAEWAKSVCK